MVEDEVEDVVVEDETEDVIQMDSFEYWAVNVINKAGHISNTCLSMQDLVAKTEYDGTWIILEWDNTHRVVEPVARLGRFIRMFNDLPIMLENLKEVPTDRKTNFYDSKIKRHFIVDDGRNKDFILSSTAKK
ncbi:unnamed protein product [Lathyrus oleraceus]|uniref:Uncharacterized protein n=1 Tax=Pisum sativum TaxID=3888 RepID=A0A9D4VQZ0_PEA|nr:hypothetical protein KIW84_073945 [Pisum sativum]